MGFINEFKEFAMRGNVVDMAVGIVIGGAFGKIVSSFVADVIMPPIGMLIGGVDFSELAFTLREAQPAADGKEAVEAITLNYGQFANTVIDFLIIAFAIFVAIKVMNTAMRKKEEEPAAPPEPPKQEVLLTEIRDLLKAKS